MPHPHRIGGHLRSALLATSLTCLAAAAQATVESGHWRVENGVYDVPSSYRPCNLYIRVDQSSSPLDYTESWLNYDAAAETLTFRGLSMDEGSELFLVQRSDVLSTSTQGNFVSLHDPYGKPVQVGSDFYLGVGTRSNSDPGSSWANQAWTSYGWAHFVRDGQGQLRIRESAMAFRESGIVVGRLTAVPEPSTYALMGLGLVGLACLRRQPQTHPA